MNGLLKLSLSRAVLAFFVVAATTAAATTRALVTTAVRPTGAAAILSGPLYTCDAERLSAMNKNSRVLGNGRILECKI